MYISELKINGFKKFKNFSIEINPNINVLIGENEEGKSTILEAIDIVLNQKYFLNQSTIFEQHFNLENIETYKSNPTKDICIILTKTFQDLFDANFQLKT